MYRQIIGYIPSNVIPALVAILMIFCYTRLLSPASFGYYNYVFSAVIVLQTSLFYALPIAVMRFFPTSIISGRQDNLLRGAYTFFYLMSTLAAILIILLVFTNFFPKNFELLIWPAFALLLLRSLVQLNQAINRSKNLMKWFNFIECLHAVLGLVGSLTAIYVFGGVPEAILIGLVFAAMICVLFDHKLTTYPFRQQGINFDFQELSHLFAYAWPLVAVAATSVIMQNGDRFLLGSIAGPEALGVFAVAYNLVERPTTLICSSISTATFPLVVQVLEHDGKEAARIQAGRNGIALLATALPACVGLAMTADYIAASLVGSAFRSGVATLIPIMSMTALARGLRGHFIDHSFHLSGRPLLMLWTYGPATILNIVLNILIIPRYGMAGAAWTALVCQGVTLISGWCSSTAVFPISLSVTQVVRCFLAALPMVFILTFIKFPLNWLGLIAAIATGSIVYIIAIIILDVGNVRSISLSSFNNYRLRKISALTD